jgi:hypothetical protein
MHINFCLACEIHIGIEGKMGNPFGEGTKQKATHLMWTPFLQRKFLQAVELLGEGTISLFVSCLTIPIYQIHSRLHM